MNKSVSIPLFKLKREARLQSRSHGIPLHVALDRIARERGFGSWSHLVSVDANKPVSDIMKNVQPGDFLLLGARPGQGKTMLALQMLIHASKSNSHGVFYTLEYTEADVLTRLRELDVDVPVFEKMIEVETSDAICADHIVKRLNCQPTLGIVVIDYLQLLDQRRENAELAGQVAQLAEAAKESNVIIVALSQIDRRFDLSSKRMPQMGDIRLPNAIDLKLFSKACFLHDGKVELAEVL